jgi:sugar/nucleoside kinase (ribokinase family)
MQSEGIDTNSVLRRSGCGPVRSVIVVDESKSTRTIFYDASQVAGASPLHPPPEMICRARVLFVDRFGMRGMIRAARIARRARVAVVADLESHRVPHLGELLRLSDHLIVSERFACALTKAKTAANAVEKLWRKDRQVVIVTAGAGGCWFREAGGRQVRHWPAERVRAVDTTGCGDVFHGAYAAALARGLPLEARLVVAAASAAIKATRHGGQAGIPTWKEVLRWVGKARASALEK